MRQANDKGTQYCSGIYTFSSQQKHIAGRFKMEYQILLSAKGMNEVMTGVIGVSAFPYIVGFHQ